MPPISPEVTFFPQRSVRAPPYCIFPSVLVIYSWVTNYYKHSSLNNMQLMWVRIWALLSWILYQSVVKVLVRAQFLFGGSTGDGSASKLTQVVGRMCSLLAVNWKFKFLLADSCRLPLALKIFPQFLVMWPSPLAPLTTWQLASLKSAMKKESDSASKMEFCITRYNHRSYLPSSLPCSVS